MGDVGEENGGGLSRMFACEKHEGMVDMLSASDRGMWPRILDHRSKYYTLVSVYCG